jgi:hypothetical protein
MIISIFLYLIIKFRHRQSILLANINKRTTTTDEDPSGIQAKKSKIETSTSNSVFKKPFPRKSALEELREVIYFLIYISYKNSVL